MRNKEEIIKEIEEIRKIKYSDEQREILMHTGGMCIIACAGSGKTTTLVDLLTTRILSGEMDNSRLLCSTYSKAGSFELGKRFKELNDRLGTGLSIKVCTLHASYNRVLRDFGFNKEICSNEMRRKFIREACKEEDVSLDEESFDTLDNLISYQVNNLLTDKQLTESCEFTLESLTDKQYSAIRNKYSQKKEDKSVMDFDDMQLIMYTYIVRMKNEQVINYCRTLWDYYFIDEFQDTSKIQYAILKELCTDTNKLIVIGDDDQSIYKWRGADPSIILNISAELNLTKFILPINYRCKSKILNLAYTGIKHSNNRQEKDMKAFKDGGKVEFLDIPDDNLYQMSKKAVEHIKKEVLERGVKLKDICLLCRNNVHGSIISNMLIAEGIDCETTDSMRLSSISPFKDMEDIIEVSGDTFDHTKVRNLLWKLIPFLGLKGSSIVSDFMYETGVSLKNALGYILKHFAALDVEWNGNVKLPAKVEDKLRYRFNGIKYDSIIGLAGLIDIIEGTSSDANKVNSIVNMYVYAVDFMYKDPDKKRLLMGVTSYIRAMVQDKGVDDTVKFMEFTKRMEKSDIFIPGDKITLSTMHSSKGLEWDNVILFASDNISYPSFYNIQKMRDKAISIPDIVEYIEGERRLNYVAMTRAKSKLTIMGSLDNLSIFMIESLGILTRDGMSNERIVKFATEGLPIKSAEHIRNRVEHENSDYLYTN